MELQSSTVVTSVSGAIAITGTAGNGSSDFNIGVALLSGAQVYLAHLVWPDYATFPNAETAFMDVYGRVGGAPMFHAMGVVLIVACFGAALSGQVAAARILFGMGRDGVLPRAFAQVNVERGTPVVGLVAIGVLSFAVSGVLNFEKASEVLNSGAFAAG